jgi:hypothetical protein
LNSQNGGPQSLEESQSSNETVNVMGRPRITLYLDTVSPFGYIAYHILKVSPLITDAHRWERLKRPTNMIPTVKNNPVFANCDVTYVPVFLGGIMTMCNNPPPVNIKSMIHPPSLLFPSRSVASSLTLTPSR